MTADMELFSFYWSLLQDHHVTVYDHLPAQGEPVSYPFAVIGEIDVTTTGDKATLRGEADLVIDVWGEREDRLAVSQIANGIMLSSIGHLRAKSFGFLGRKSDQQVQMMTDTSVASTVYARGMVSIKLQIE